VVRQGEVRLEVKRGARYRIADRARRDDNTPHAAAVFPISHTFGSLALDRGSGAPFVFGDVGLR
jgi:hypothetical protein